MHSTGVPHESQTYLVLFAEDLIVLGVPFVCRNCRVGTINHATKSALPVRQAHRAVTIRDMDTVFFEFLGNRSRRSSAATAHDLQSPH